MKIISYCDNAWTGGISSGQFGMIDFTGDGVKDLAMYDRSSNMLNLSGTTAAVIFMPRSINTCSRATYMAS